MHNTRELKQGEKRGLTADQIVTRSNDPKFYSALDILPNPDPVLRKLNMADDVFNAIGSDAHVMGEKRAIRSGLLRFEWRVAPGGEQPADIRAFELCQQRMNHRPAPGMRWSDVIWNKATAVLRGIRFHEVSWKREGNLIMPDVILDKPNRRFVYGMDNELRYKTRSDPIKGIEAEAFRFLVTRHMPSYENPYGEAIYSSCFWPYTFKHAGFKFFAKFCEKYGFPWPVGKYPDGTPDKEQEALAIALQKMIEDAVAVIPDTGSVEILNNNVSGKLVHESLIMLCNSEMSKALTSQTLTTEIQGDGSRAASQVHREKETAVNESDRDMIVDTFNELFEWITIVNVPGATPPYFEFYDDAEARQEWVTVIDTARNFVDIPTKFVYETLQIPQPAEGDDVVPRSTAPSPATPPEFAAGPKPGTSEFRNQQLAEVAADRADELLQALPEAARTLLDDVDTLAEFQQRLPSLYPEMDDIKLGELTALALMTGVLDGMNNADENNE